MPRLLTGIALPYNTLGRWSDGSAFTIDASCGRSLAEDGEEVPLHVGRHPFDSFSASIMWSDRALLRHCREGIMFTLELRDQVARAFDNDQASGVSVGFD